METVVQDEALKEQIYEGNARRVLRLDDRATVRA
jgi:hypothetical protein